MWPSSGAGKRPNSPLNLRGQAKFFEPFWPRVPSSHLHNTPNSGIKRGYDEVEHAEYTGRKSPSFPMIVWRTSGNTSWLFPLIDSACARTCRE